MPSIDISPEQRSLVLSLLTSYLPGVTAWAFGSRVKSSARPHSDLDLVVFTDRTGSVASLKEAFEESSLPFRVDVLVWSEIPENFRQNILDQYAVLTGNERGQEAGD